MADLLWFDGFDDYSYAQAITANYYNSASLTGNYTASFVAGRNGNGLQINGTINGVGGLGAFQKTVAPGSTTAYIGMAFRATALPPTSNILGILSVCDVSVPQVTLSLRPDGTLAVWNGYNGLDSGGATFLGASSASISAGTWNYIELRVTVHNTAGVVTVMLNGTQIINLTGVNTRHTANTSWNNVLIGNSGAGTGLSGNNGVIVTYDDLYIHDGTGIYNGFLGDSVVGVVLASAQGNYLDGTCTPATSPVGSHYLNINENPPNDDTTVVDMSVVGNRESYQYVIPTTGHIIWAAALRPYMKKTDAGPRTVTDFVRSGGTNYDGATALAPSNVSYQEFMFIRAQDPSTGAAWTAGTKELGIKVVS